MNFVSELKFYFNNNMFIKSNMFSSLLGASYTPIRMFQGIATYDESFSDKDLKQIRYYNKIAHKFAKLTSEQRKQCVALFDHEWQCPYMLAKAVGPRGGLLIWYADKETLTALCKNKL